MASLLPSDLCIKKLATRLLPCRQSIYSLDGLKLYPEKGLANEYAVDPVNVHHVRRSGDRFHRCEDREVGRVREVRISHQRGLADGSLLDTINEHCQALIGLARIEYKTDL